MGILYDAVRGRLFQNNVLVIDEQGEYENLCKALGGEVIKFKPENRDVMNIFEMAGGKVTTEEK